MYRTRRTHFQRPGALHFVSVLFRRTLETLNLSLCFPPLSLGRFFSSSSSSFQLIVFNTKVRFIYFFFSITSYIECRKEYFQYVFRNFWRCERIFCTFYKSYYITREVAFFFDILRKFSIFISAFQKVKMSL